jgi:regulator of nucleoside diphosphate kinase
MGKDLRLLEVRFTATIRPVNKERQMLDSQVFIVEADAARLRGLLSARTRDSHGRDQGHLLALAAELERATLVDAADVPGGVVTLHSRVRLVDLDTGERSELTVVFPSAADPGAGRVSVLAPLGCALMGYREGKVVEWTMPGGLRRLRIEEVLPPQGDEANTVALAQVAIAV